MTYTFPAYIPMLVALAALIVAVLGVVLHRRGRPRPVLFVCLGVAAFLGIGIAPGIALDRVVLDDEKLEQTTGFWFAPTVKGFYLADVSSITIRNVRDRRNRWQEVWFIAYRDSTTSRIDPGDLWEMNGPEIAERLRARGIVVTVGR